MFPLSDSVKSGKIPFVTLFLIGINCYVFFLQISSPDPDFFIKTYALTPSGISLFNFSALMQFVTSIFLHGGIFHIVSNMWFLWIFGDNVEAHVGKLRYLFLFLLTGIAGNVLQYAINPASTIPMLGASGAVSGVLGAYILLLPASKIKTILPLFFVFSIVEIPAFVYIFYWFIVQLFSGIASLPFAFQSGGVAFWAHIGGFTSSIWIVGRFNQPKKPEIIEGELVE